MTEDCRFYWMRSNWGSSFLLLFKFTSLNGSPCCEAAGWFLKVPSFPFFISYRATHLKNMLTREGNCVHYFSQRASSLLCTCNSPFRGPVSKALVTASWTCWYTVGHLFGCSFLYQCMQRGQGMMWDDPCQIFMTLYYLIWIYGHKSFKKTRSVTHNMKTKRQMEDLAIWSSIFQKQHNIKLNPRLPGKSEVSEGFNK